MGGSPISKNTYALSLLSHATQAIRRGVDVFTLQSTLGDSSSATTGAYVAANPPKPSPLAIRFPDNSSFY
jgi:hypothetical protein